MDMSRNDHQVFKDISYWHKPITTIWKQQHYTHWHTCISATGTYNHQRKWHYTHWHTYTLATGTPNITALHTLTYISTTGTSEHYNHQTQQHYTHWHTFHPLVHLSTTISKHNSTTHTDIDTYIHWSNWHITAQQSLNITTSHTLTYTSATGTSEHYNHQR